MLKSITEYIIAGTVIFVGISLAIVLLILIVSSFQDFLYGIKRRNK